MRLNRRIRVALASIFVVTVATLLLIGPTAELQEKKKKEFDGHWLAVLDIPPTPGASRQAASFIFDVHPRGNLPQGRMTVTNDDGVQVDGVWRQVKKKFSVAWELPCAGEDPCGSVIIFGKLKQDFATMKKGDIIVMWDTPDDKNHAQFETSKGKIAGGFRIAPPELAEDEDEDEGDDEDPGDEGDDEDPEP